MFYAFSSKSPNIKRVMDGRRELAPYNAIFSFHGIVSPTDGRIILKAKQVPLENKPFHWKMTRLSKVQGKLEIKELNSQKECEVNRQHGDFQIVEQR